MSCYSNRSDSSIRVFCLSVYVLLEYLNGILINQWVLTVHYLMSLNDNKGKAMYTVYIHKIDGHIIKLMSPVPIQRHESSVQLRNNVKVCYQHYRAT